MASKNFAECELPFTQSSANKFNDLNLNSNQKLNYSQNHKTIVVSKQTGFESKVNDDMSFQKESFHNTDKSSDLFNLGYLSSNNDRNRGFGYWSKEVESSGTKGNSLLSHISAYENSFEESSGVTVISSLMNQKRLFNHFLDIGYITGTNWFEIPRQQDDTPTPPEVMQFKASQKLLKPSETQNPAPPPTSTTVQSLTGDISNMRLDDRPSVNSDEEAGIEPDDTLANTAPTAIASKNVENVDGSVENGPTSLLLQQIAAINAFRNSGGIIVDEKIYEYVKELGRGGFGAVKLMKEIGSQKLVAVKTVEKGLEVLGPPINFESEFVTMLRLKHLHIIELFGHIDTTERITLFLEYCAQGSFQTYVEEKSKEPGWNAQVNLCFFGGQLLSALNYMNQQNIIHRDLKPQNLLLNGWTIKVADFGISKILAKNGDTLLSDVGTTGYKSPQIGKSPYTSKADIFSSGVIFLNVLTGSFDLVDEMIVKLENEPCHNMIADMIKAEEKDRINFANLKQTFLEVFPMSSFTSALVTFVVPEEEKQKLLQCYEECFHVVNGHAESGDGVDVDVEFNDLGAAGDSNELQAPNIPLDRIAFYRKNDKNDGYHLVFGGKKYYRKTDTLYTCANKTAKSIKCTARIMGRRIDAETFEVTQSFDHVPECL